MSVKSLLIKYHIIKQPQEDLEKILWLKTLGRWNNDWGDVTRRLNYDLNEKSVVFDIGGYKGQWASDIFAKFRCKIYIFEPIKKYAEFIRSRLNFPSRIIVEAYGASTHKHSQYLYIDNEKSSSNLESEAKKSLKMKINMIDLCKYISDKKINHIDLMKINIEGDEYELLNKIISSGTIERINNLQIQFHRFIDDSSNKRKKLRHLLRKTHKETYNYPFIWESWKLK